MDFVTSDLHFGHKNIMKYCPKTRGHYNDVDHMNSDMIRMWNQIVSPDDHTYILGDVSFANLAQTVSILNSLNGIKTLISGNHDRKLLKQKEFIDCFVDVQNYYSIRVDKIGVVMFHYPIHEWDEAHKGAVHLHGHCHGTPSGLEHYRCRDVGFDATGKIVIPLNEIITDALKGELKTHHGRVNEDA